MLVNLLVIVCPPCIELETQTQYVLASAASPGDQHPPHSPVRHAIGLSHWLVEQPRRPSSYGIEERVDDTTFLS